MRSIALPPLMLLLLLPAGAAVALSPATAPPAELGSPTASGSHSAAGLGARIKDIARAQGDRHNQLVGYGLVVGLEGTGDTAQVPFTNQAVRNLVSRFGNRPETAAQIKTKNAAAVMLTADLRPFAKPGDRIDVVVSSLGDARSLQGGVLLQAPLEGADGQVYAVAQGSVSIGGFAAGGPGAQVTRNHPTVGRIPGGALVEAAPPADGSVGDSLTLCLHHPDAATAVAMAQAIDQALAGASATALDSGTVAVSVPEAFRGRPTELLAAIEELAVPVDLSARVIINERTGTILVGGPVTISPIAVAHGNLTVEIKTSAAVSQPPPLSPGRTVAIPDTTVSATEETGQLAQFRAATVDDLVRALNALHASPRDLIAILQAIEQAGALNAALEVL
jgi:flagellar P-ring protein precursor FlgI